MQIRAYRQYLCHQAVQGPAVAVDRGVQGQVAGVIAMIEDVADPKVAEAFVREFARRTRESVGSQAVS